MPVSRTRHLREVDLDAAAGAAGHLEGRGRQAGGSHVLDADDGVRREELEARLQEQLLGERVADLHRRALLLRLVAGELLGGHRRAVDAVAAGLRADVDDGVARPLRAPEEDPVRSRRCPALKTLTRMLPSYAGVERRLAADRRDADAVAVAGDPAHDAVDEVLHPGRRERPEPQRVQATRSAARPS